MAAFPALKARPAGVGGHIRPGLVDDGDDAERSPLALDLDAVVELPAVGDDADRVGQSGHLAEPGSHARDAGVCEQQPVEQRLAHTFAASLLHVIGVGGEDAGSGCVETVGHGSEGSVLLGRGGFGNDPGSIFGLSADLVEHGRILLVPVIRARGQRHAFGVAWPGCAWQSVGLRSGAPVPSGSATGAKRKGYGGTGNGRISQSARLPPEQQRSPTPRSVLQLPDDVGQHL